MHTANPNRKPVNQKAGPRMGNMNPGDKVANLKERRSSSSGLSDMINTAYAARQSDYQDKTFKNEGAIQPNVKPRKLKK